MSLMLAMGAEHTTQEKLAQIIATINSQRNAKDALSQKAIGTYEMIGDRYNIGKFDLIGMNKLINQDFIVEEKYDGYSYLNSGGRFYSKRLSQAKGNEGMPVEKTDHMPHISIIMQLAHDMCGCDVQGELYVPGGISDDVTKILGCTAEEAVRRTKEIALNKGCDSILHYRLIDIRRYQDIDITNEPYYVRRIILEHVYHTFIKPYDMEYNYIQLAEILDGDPCEQFKRIVNSGGEGIIIKKTNGLYIPGKKPANNWIKGKKKVTHDVVIMGFKDGTGKNAKLFGSIKIGHYIDGKLTPCGYCSSGLNDETRLMIASDPDSWIGKVIEIEAIQESVKSFRNAVFKRIRDDKDAEDCIPVNIHVVDHLL